jgi:hypothetical protein
MLVPPGLIVQGPSPPPPALSCRPTPLQNLQRGLDGITMQTGALEAFQLLTDRLGIGVVSYVGSSV